MRNDVGAVKITRLPLRPRPGGRHRVSPAPLKCRGFMIGDRAGRELLPRTSRDCRRQIVSPPTWSALLIEDRRRNRPVERSAPERRSAIESTCRLQSRRYLTERPRAISGLRHSSGTLPSARRRVGLRNARCPLGPTFAVHMIAYGTVRSALSGEQRESDLHKSDAGMKSRKRCAAGHYADRDQQRVRFVLVA